MESHSRQCSHFICLTEIFAKLKNNSLIQAEPSEVHFSGFELGKDHKQVLVSDI